MCRLQELSKWLCLLLLAAGIAYSQADDFPQCINVEVDTFVVALDDCTSYIYCNGENSFRDTCPDQTYFDGVAQECAFDDAGVCLHRLDATTMKAPIIFAADLDINNNNAEELHVDETTTSSSSSTTVKPAAPGGSRPQCDTAGDGYHPHPQRCEYYYSCLGGYLTIVRCPYKFGWDYAEGRCKPMSEVHCFSL